MEPTKVLEHTNGYLSETERFVGKSFIGSTDRLAFLGPSLLVQI